MELIVMLIKCLIFVSPFILLPWNPNLKAEEHL